MGNANLRWQKTTSVFLDGGGGCWRVEKVEFSGREGFFYGLFRGVVHTMRWWGEGHGVEVKNGVTNEKK